RAWAQEQAGLPVDGPAGLHERDRATDTTGAALPAESQTGWSAPGLPIPPGWLRSRSRPGTARRAYVAECTRAVRTAGRRASAEREFPPGNSPGGGAGYH